MANDQKAAGGVKGILSKVMPFISAAAPLGGPAGVLAAGILGKVLGSPESPAKVAPTPDGIAAALAAIGADPVLIEKGKEAEQQFQLQLKQMDITSVEELERIAAGDRADARQLEIKTGDKWTPRILAAIVVVGWIVVQCYVLPHALRPAAPPDPSMISIVSRLLGTLDGALMLVLAFYFGSSIGSERKTEILAKNAAQASHES